MMGKPHLATKILSDVIYINWLYENRIPPRELFGRFSSQTIKTSWRKTHDITVDVCLKATFTDEPKERIRLLQEAAILAQFRHPNVIRLQGIISNENVVSLSMNMCYLSLFISSKLAPANLAMLVSQGFESNE